MTEPNRDYHIPDASTQEDDTDIPPKMIEKLLRQVHDGPLKDVEDIILPERWPPFPTS